MGPLGQILKTANNQLSNILSIQSSSARDADNLVGYLWLAVIKITCSMLIRVQVIRTFASPNNWQVMNWPG